MEFNYEMFEEMLNSNNNTIVKPLKFNWKNFNEDKFYDMIALYKKSHISVEDCYFGCVTIGELCFDIVVRNRNGEDFYVLEFACYVANEDTGYGYRNDCDGNVLFAYDCADGFDMQMPEDYSCLYSEFVESAEYDMEKFICTETMYDFRKKASSEFEWFPEKITNTENKNNDCIFCEIGITNYYHGTEIINTHRVSYTLIKCNRVPIEEEAYEIVKDKMGYKFSVMMQPVELDEVEVLRNYYDNEIRSARYYNFA